MAKKEERPGMIEQFRRYNHRKAEEERAARAAAASKKPNPLGDPRNLVPGSGGKRHYSHIQPAGPNPNYSPPKSKSVQRALDTVTKGFAKPPTGPTPMAGRVVTEPLRKDMPVRNATGPNLGKYGANTVPAAGSRSASPPARNVMKVAGAAKPKAVAKPAARGMRGDELSDFLGLSKDSAVRRNLAANAAKKK